MARLNRSTAGRYSHVVTHEGGQAYPHLNAEQQLRRLVLSSLLWEDQFYVDGVMIADAITQASDRVPLEVLANLAIEARELHHLRHVPLLLLVSLIRRGAGFSLVQQTIARVIQRADELAELLALYWAVNGKDKPLAAQLKKGLAAAFGKFDAYQLGKYNRDGEIKLRDVLRLVHPTPKDDAQSLLWKQLKEGTLPTPDTWEVQLSGGADKKETFTRLIVENKLGYLALLRNLRNMQQAGVDPLLVRGAILERRGAGRVLPFRYIAAAKAAPMYESEIDKALIASLGDMQPLGGETIVLVDVSSSMNWALSGKSDLTRMVAAATLASIIPGNVRVFTFSDSVVEVPRRPGMAGVEKIIDSQYHSGTYLGKAVEKINRLPHHRLIVITDEQSADRVPAPVADRAYMINVASYENGVGYGGKWVHIDGFSENTIKYIQEIENLAVS